jgi:putative ABC transport system permease protein
MTLLSKVWFDLWQDKSRTLQVVMVIALGAIAIGLVIGGRNVIANTVLTGWQAAEPPHIKLAVTPPLDDEQLERLARIEGVDEAEGLLTQGIEWRLQGEEEWTTGRLEGRDDYVSGQKMGLDGLLDGRWPLRNEVAIGLNSVGPDPGVEIGDVLQIRSGETVREYPVVGLMDPIGPSPTFGINLRVIAERNTFERITGRDTYDLVQTRSATWDRELAEATDLRIQEFFEDIDVDSVGVLFPFQDRITPPDVPPAAAILNGIFFLLGLIGVIVVILGIFLVNNSISAIVTQQVNQIGVLKAVGASSRQVLSTYLILVVSYGLLATLISIPIGFFAARGLQVFFAGFLNIENATPQVDPTAVMIQALICLAAPLLAATLPLWSGARITVREAISTYGLTGGAGFVDRTVARVRSVPYSALLIIGNTFRNRRRVLVVEIALIAAGAIFMAVLGLSDATDFTYGDKLAAVHKFDVAHSFEEDVRDGRLQNVVAAEPQITHAEGWLVGGAKARPAAQADSTVEDPNLTIFAIPQETRVYQPEMKDGRWFDAAEDGAVVLHSRLAQEMNLEPGDNITLTSADGRESTWRVVGTLFDPASNSAVYLPLDEWQREAGRFDRVNTVWAQVAPGADAQAAAAALETRLENEGISVAARSPFGANTLEEIIDDLGGGFDIILQLLAIMAVVIALVGGVGLSGVLSLSVLERRREIGVLRSIGASSWQVTRLFVGEGLLLALIGWLVAIPISVPIAYLLATRGLSLALNTQLFYRFTPTGLTIWLFVIVVLAFIASALPARGAARISVRESLSYQ